MDLYKIFIHPITSQISIYATDDTLSYVATYGVMDAPTPEYNIGYIDCVYFIMSKDTISKLDNMLNAPVSIEELRLDTSNNCIIAPNYDTLTPVPMNYGAISYTKFIGFDRLIMSFNSMYTTTIALAAYGGNTKYYQSIKEDEAINLMMHSKVADNIISYVKDNHHMVIYKGIIPVNAADSLGLRISDINHNRFLADFILKKKGEVFHYVFQYMNLVS